MTSPAASVEKKKHVFATCFPDSSYSAVDQQVDDAEVAVARGEGERRLAEADTAREQRGVALLDGDQAAQQRSIRVCAGRHWRRASRTATMSAATPARRRPHHIATPPTANGKKSDEPERPMAAPLIRVKPRVRNTGVS